ncbi:MAG TPA: hypothetical protein ACQGQH_07095 [Xylella sp.]
MDLRFSALFINRTNRSGILKAGVIGGLNQTGNYRLDCRFNKMNLVQKIKRIAMYRDQVRLFREDAYEFLKQINKRTPDRSLINIDPPYYNKGPELYCSFYKHRDHVRLSRGVRRLQRPWMLTYDDTPEIADLYDDLPMFRKEINYSVQAKRVGVELMVLDAHLTRPPSLGSAKHRA